MINLLLILLSPTRGVMYRDFNYNLFPPALVHPESQSLGFLSMTQCEALSCIEVTRGEYLLVFNLLAVYVDASGRKSREKEIMYPAIPTAVGKMVGWCFL